MTTADRAEHRLRHLYDISTRLTRFAGIDETLPEVIDIAARAMPVRSAALVLDTRDGLRSHVFRTAEVDDAGLAAALEHAIRAYAWFAAGSSLVERERPPPSIRPLPPLRAATSVAAPRFVILPLVVEREHVFGAIQVESASTLDEADVFFLNAVANQVAVAIHRQTAIEAAESRVRAQLDFTRAITASLGDAIVAVDANACISFMNPAAVQLLGFAEGAVLGAPAAETLRVRLADGADAGADAGVIECPLLRALAGSRVASDDHAFMTCDGRAVPVSYVAAPIADAAGISGATVAFRDVLAVKRSERVQRLLADCSDVLGASLDPDAMLAALTTRVVPSFADACTVGPDRERRASPAEVVVPLRAREHSFGALAFAMTSSGRTFPSADHDVAKEIGRRAAVALENARLHAQTEKAVRDREEILAVVSHDLRSPLNTIVMAVMSIRERRRRAIDPEDRRLVDIVARAADRMSRLTRDLLDVSSIEANRLSIDPRPTRVEAIARDLVEALETSAGARSVVLTVSQPDATLLAYCDPDRILQVLSNLVGNAIKFTPAGGHVDVAIEGAGDRVLFVVCDTGAGISPDLLPHVFERHRQAPETAAKGRGLGLFIAKGIVEAHGGQIRVESTPGVGTAFEFYVPRARAEIAKTTSAVVPEAERAG